jgi:magnesium transporter
MKVLTIISTIFIPLTFLAGIEGMNFKFMPELEWTYSYPVLLLFMALISVMMLLFFRKKQWL